MKTYNTLPFHGEHYLFGEYVLTGITDAIDIPNACGVDKAFGGTPKLTYWLSKKGWTKAQYCFTAANKSELEDQLKHIDTYIFLFQSAFENTPVQADKVGYLLRVTEENVDGCGGKCDMYVRFECPITKAQRDRFGELLDEAKEDDANVDYDTEDMVCTAIERFVVETGIIAELASGLADDSLNF